MNWLRWYCEYWGFCWPSTIEVANNIIIKVKSTLDNIPCHKCGKDCKHYGSGTKLKLRHFSILERKTFIEIVPPRGICEHCDKNTTTNWKRQQLYSKPKTKKRGSKPKATKTPQQPKAIKTEQQTERSKNTTETLRGPRKDPPGTPQGIFSKHC